MRRTHAQLERALTERLLLEEEREKMTVSLITDASLESCDLCFRPIYAPVLDDPQLSLLNLYEVRYGEEEYDYEYACEDCLDQVLAEAEEDE